MMINKIALKVNPSTQQHKCWGLSLTPRGVRLNQRRDARSLYPITYKNEASAPRNRSILLRRSPSGMSIEIQLKIIYVDTIQFIPSDS